MPEWNLPLFPQDGVAVTVTVTVWIGVCVVVFFNLRFGWTLSGLVVPGYLAPLLLTQPVSVAIIAGEAVVTYSIVFALSEGCCRLPCWSSFFGRDRFFALVLFSVLVRAGADGWLLPLLGQWLNETYGLDIDYRNNLHSYGLIAVALMANCFWKPGLARGGFTLVVTIGLTYLLVRYGLIEWTNFSLGGLHYLYEDISSSLLASPKAYIVIITTAFLASWMNLRYSWDFNGILIPALLALLWHEPTKIAISLVETLWILMLASLVLKLPLWRRMTMEGGRKLLLFFTIATAHRVLVAHLLPRFVQLQVTDAFGFGYLLTTLLAVKAHEKQITTRLLRATVQVSVLGAVLGSLAGFALTWLPSDLWMRPLPATITHDAALIEKDQRALREVLQEQKVRLYRTWFPGSYLPPARDEIDRFCEGVRHILRFMDDRERDQLLAAQSHLAAANYRLHTVRPRYVVLCESSPGRGWGCYVLNLTSRGGLLVEVPLPLDEPGTLDAGLALFQAMDGRALAVGGTARDTNSDGSSNMLLQRRTMLSAFHRLVGANDTLQIRGSTVDLRQTHTVSKRGDSRLADDRTSSRLWVDAGLPPSLKLPVLKEFVPSFDLRWQRTATRNVLRDQSRRGFAELVLNPRDRQQLQIHTLSLSPATTQSSTVLQGHLHEWLMQDLNHIALMQSQAYVPATMEEMLFLDREVVVPLLQLAARHTRFDDYGRGDWQLVQAIRASSWALHYDLILFHDQSSDDDLLLLVEKVPKSRHWGTFLFRCGQRHPYAVEIPRPLHERYAYEFGISLFERPTASALLIAGAHPKANSDGSADVTRLANKVSALNLVRQVLLREQPFRPLVITQSRAIRAPVGADAVLAMDHGIPHLGRLPPLIERLISQLQEDGLKITNVDGAVETAGYELGILLQSSSTNHSRNKRMISLWLSPSVRQKFRESAQQALYQSQFDAMEIPTLQAELGEYLLSLKATPAAESSDQSIRKAVRSYLENRDILRLWKLRHNHASWQLVRLLDPASGQAFLLTSREAGQLPMVFNLSGAVDRQRLVVSEGLSVQQVREFVRSRAGCLKIRRSP